MIKKGNSKAFSMVEVIVAAMLLTTTIAVVFGTIMASRKPMVEADKSVRAAIFAKKVMAELRGKVDAEDVTSFTTGVIHAAPLEEDGYTAKYTVTIGADGTRKVDITITW